MAQKYIITYSVDERAKVAFLSAADKHGDLVRVARQVEGEPAPVTYPPVQKRREHVYANGQRNKGISGEQLVIDSLLAAPRPMSSQEMMNVFVARGFAGNSASPCLSKLRQAGRVTQHEVTGLWALAPTHVNGGGGQ